MTDSSALRAALGSFMTGVTVVTTSSSAGQPVGFTANSFTSVSLDPPLLLVCLANSLNCLDAFTNTEHFAVNILEATQQETSNTFATFDGDRFADIDYRLSPLKNPLLDKVAAWFDCTVESRVEAGDHTIYIGRIHSFFDAESDGLGYARHGYFSLQHEQFARDLQQSAAQLTTGFILEYDGQILLLKNEKGYNLPCATGAAPLTALKSDLQNAGISMRAGTLYSIFEHGGSDVHSIYYRARCKMTSDPGPFVLWPIDKLPLDLLNDTAIVSMLKRYQYEHSIGSYGIYHGSEKQGQVTMLDENGQTG